MSTGYIIRDTVTGERFTAGSGKNIWSTKGGAKVAWRQSSWTLSRLIGEPGSNGYRFDPGSFNDQTRFVVEELTSNSGQLEKAKKLLKDALEALCNRHADECDEAEAIREFLGMESQV